MVINCIVSEGRSIEIERIYRLEIIKDSEIYGEDFG
jgi:hypothetical protein